MEPKDRCPWCSTRIAPSGQPEYVYVQGNPEHGKVEVPCPYCKATGLASEWRKHPYWLQLNQETVKV